MKSQSRYSETLTKHAPFWPLRNATNSPHHRPHRPTKVPAGACVIYCPYAMGRDPNIWDDPLTFKPERFLGQPEPSPYKYALILTNHQSINTSISHSSNHSIHHSITTTTATTAATATPATAATSSRPASVPRTGWAWKEWEANNPRGAECPRHVKQRLEVAMTCSIHGGLSDLSQGSKFTQFV